MTRVQLRLFGYPTLTSDGAAITGPAAQRHRLALLTVLALAPERTVPREKLFALLWPDAETTSARHLLNTAVHVIRRALSNDVLAVRRDDITLSSTVEIDVHQFERHLAQGQQEHAITVATAPFLDAFFLDGAPEFDQWVAAERSRLTSKCAEALEALASGAESSGNLSAAVTWWQALNRADPLNTRAVLRLMLALERSGDHGNALEVAREHESLLAREMDAAAPPQFHALVKRMREHPNGLEVPTTTPNGAARDSRANEPGPLVLTGAAADRLSAQPPHARISRRSVTAAAASLTIVAVIGVWLLAGQPRYHPSSIIIGAFENLSGDSTFTSAGTELREALVRDASQWSLVRVVEPGAPESQATVLPTLGPRDRPGTLIDGTLRRVADSLRLDVRLVDRRNDHILRVVSFVAPAVHIPTSAINEFSERVLGALATIIDDRFATVITPDHSPPRFQAYLEFAVGLELHSQANHDDTKRFSRAIAADSSFTLASAWLIRALDQAALFVAAETQARALTSRSPPVRAADRLTAEWLLARYRGDLRSAYRSAQSLAELLPGSPWVLTASALAINLRRPHEAGAMLDDLRRRSPWIGDWTEYIQLHGRVLHLLGRFDEERALATANRHRATNLIVRLIAESRPLAAQGRLAEIDLLVNEALATSEQPNMNEGSLMQRVAAELRAHGHDDAARVVFQRARSWYEGEMKEAARPAMYPWALGQMLLYLGELDSARAVFQRLYSAMPRMYRSHGELALMGARTGDTAEYAYFDSLLARPDSSWNNFDASLRIWYRARAAAERGAKEQAVELLQAAVARGVPVDLDPVHIDPAFRVLRGTPAFDELTRLRR